MKDINNEFYRQVDNAVRTHLNEQEMIPTDDELRETYESFYDIFVTIPQYKTIDVEARADVIDRMVQDYASQMYVTKRVGFAYVDEDTKPWLNDVNDDIDWFYWGRYQDYLIRTKKWSRAAVRSVKDDTREVLDLMANPKLEQSFERRGLVVASVQSGKTANYIGLVCRAADAGYKIIIIMAGVHNMLRNQTQKRLEEGFIGFDIEEATRKPVGVGINDDRNRPVVFTSRVADFSKSRAEALRAVQTDHFDVPMVFVVKKNSNSLKQVYEWLKENAKANDQLLLIDDEADNASINGKYKRDRREDEPTRINGQIRNILNFFSRACYVGYTATPYANILIDPTIDHDEFRRDLFPQNFIYTLEESSDYFGATKVFGDYDEPTQRYIRFIEDIDVLLPPKHKSDTTVEALPQSMKDAIRAFVIATTIRDMRDDEDAHSTMMINVSPYKQPQKAVATLVKDYLEDIINAVKSYSALPETEALKASQLMRGLRDTWVSEYKQSSEPANWSDIQKYLYGAIRAMHVVSVNTDSNDVLDYENQTERVIVVGGYRLSRGLTLEGLVVSYYSRNARAYDSLMQMARWFGYRFGYEDLCRIWMSEQAAGWYKFVADATEDLFDELRDMRQILKTPKEYGLKIRQSPDSLTVTARNKMGTGQLVKAPIDLNNGFVETIAFLRDEERIRYNYKAAEDLFRVIAPYLNEDKTENLYTSVPVRYILDFLLRYENDDVKSPNSQRTPVMNYIDDRIIDGELQEWDVYIAHGTEKTSGGRTVGFPAIGEIWYERRYPGSRTTRESLVVGEKQRLASRGVEKIGLSDDEIESAEEDFYSQGKGDGASISDRFYRKYRKRPLLVIHPVIAAFDPEVIERKKSEGKQPRLPEGWIDWEHSEPALGWSISLPRSERQTKLVDYVFNEIALLNIKSEFEEESDDDYEDE